MNERTDLCQSEVIAPYRSSSIRWQLFQSLQNRKVESPQEIIACHARLQVQKLTTRLADSLGREPLQNDSGHSRTDGWHHAIQCKTAAAVWRVRPNVSPSMHATAKV